MSVDEITEALKGSEFIIQTSFEDDKIMKIIWTGWISDLTVVTLKDTELNYANIEKQIYDGVTKDVYLDLLTLMKPLERENKINDILNI